MKKLIPATVIFLAFWLALVFSLEPGVLLVGVVLAALVAAAAASSLPDCRWLLSPVRLLWLLLYIPYFLGYCIKANLDVAYRVLHPDVPIRPGIVKVTTELTTPLGKTFLANSITLTPGTLTVDIIDQTLYVHWINIETDDPEAQTELLVRRFERMLKEIFE
jgi:multicomponent Na+:H+ antiporter subunit E